MIRAAVLLVFVAAFSASAQELKPYKLEVGQTGYFPKARSKKENIGGMIHGKLSYKVATIISESEVAVRVGAELYQDQVWVEDYFYFVLKGQDTSKLADDSAVTFFGKYKVTGTQKVGRKTLLVVEPLKPMK